MMQRFAERWLLLLLSCNLTLSLYAAPQPDETGPGATSPSFAHTDSSNLVFHPIRSGGGDGQIGHATAWLLEKIHYLHKPFDASISTHFFDRYLEMLDPQHLHFLQSDLAEFDHYRTNLDRLTLHDNTQPAYDIYNRFVERLQQRVAYVQDLLQHQQFTFDADERILINRKDQPYPKDLAEARKLWKERLRFEFLQEKLVKLDAKKKGGKVSSPHGAEVTEVNPKNGAPKKSETEEIVETLSHRYSRNLHTFIDWDNDDVLQIYLTTLAHIYDPHSDYFNHSQLDSFAIGMNLSLFGIGAELSSEDGYCTIRRLLAGGPAAKSKKIKENDKIIAVAQSNQPPVDVVDMSLSKAVQLIRGPKGTEVKLTIIPAGEDASARVTIALVRDEIKLEDQEAKAKIIDMPNGQGQTIRVGVIDLPSFYASFDPSNTRSRAEPKSTTADVARLINKLKEENVRGVILDLRHNGGGSLEEAIRLTGLFIKDGPVVQVKNWDGRVEEERDDDPTELYEGPLIVLTSRLSASASEILAGALQDYGRALIVGDSSTHGKGTVQTVQPLREAMLRLGLRGFTNDPGALKVTIKKFYRPSGASTQNMGVVPDIVLPSVFNISKDIGETNLDNALPYDTISRARFQSFNEVAPYLSELRRRSEERVKNDKDFSYIREDMDIFQKQQADKTISLNEAQRLKEKAESDARAKAREKERLARQEPPEKIYEISLKQASLPPGVLPPPPARTNANLFAGPVPFDEKGQGLAGTSTNGGIAAVKPGFRPAPKDGSDRGNLESDAAEEKAPAFDAALIESEHILVDYLSVFGKGNVATVP